MFLWLFVLIIQVCRDESKFAEVPSMFPHPTSLVLPSLAKHQVNAVELKFVTCSLMLTHVV